MKVFKISYGGYLTELMCVAVLAILTLVLSAPAAAAQASWYKVLYSFGATPTDSYAPVGALLAAPGHVFYGATNQGGVAGVGTVFELDPPSPSNGPWTETVIHSFGAAGDLTYPQGSLVVDTTGVLYGVVGGGVYSLTPPSVPGGAWSETSVPISGTRALTPVRALFINKKGILFGQGAEFHGYKTTVFGLETPLGSTTANVVGLFDGTDLYGELLGAPGGLYGTTWPKGDIPGSVFQLTLPSAPGGAWTGTTIYSFPPNSPAESWGRLALDTTSGVLYGVANSDDGCGVVYALTPPATAGGAWTETILHSFSGTDGCHPEAGVILSGGSLYGTTWSGGENDLGAVFSLNPPATSEGSWAYTLLHSFGGSTDGIGPTAAPTMVNGVLFGTTTFGGSNNNAGTIFALRP